MTQAVPDLPEKARRRVLFIRHRSSCTPPEFLHTIENGWVATLSLHCDLTTIEEDFDYGRVCDRLNPDFVVFEDPGGARSVPLKITNASARQDIPKIGLLIQDPHDTARVSFLRLLDELNIERFFTMAGTIRQSPELAARAFTLGLYANDAVYRDYGLEKLLPVTIFGANLLGEFYKWRAEVSATIALIFPTLLYTHPGYVRPIPRYRYPIHGADYARMLNRSHFSLADTTREGYAVWKHLEIPACRTILVAPDSPELGYYGFQDMRNCILGSGKPLLEKIAAVAESEELYRSICDAGHELVHTRHARRHWRWLADWYECHRALTPGEAVQQQGVMGPFRAVREAAPTIPIRGGAQLGTEFTAGMNRALAILLGDGDLAEAARLLSEMVGWLSHINEPWVLLGVLALLMGKPQQAKELLLQAWRIRSQRSGHADFDPEESAWLGLTALLLQDPELMETASRAADRCAHVSLRRMAELRCQLAAGRTRFQATPAAALERQARDRLSVHWMSQIDLSDWTRLINRILAANGWPEQHDDSAVAAGCEARNAVAV